MNRFVTLVVLCSLSAGALAQSWPAKPVRVLVPAPAGSSLDIIARTLGDKLKDRWGQPVVIENKAGAGGMLGMDVVAKAPPDGYTLGIGFNGPIASSGSKKAVPGERPESGVGFGDDGKVLHRFIALRARRSDQLDTAALNER